jgi:hypothetical protein
MSAWAEHDRLKKARNQREFLKKSGNEQHRIVTEKAMSSGVTQSQLESREYSPSRIGLGGGCYMRSNHFFWK